MSIATEIQRLRTAKADIKTAIEEKGVEVGNGLIDTYAEKISEISVGGSGVERYATLINFENLNLFGAEEVVFNLDNAKSLNSFYMPKSETANETVKHITVNCPNQISSMRDAFRGASYPDYFLEHITLNVDTSKSQWWLEVFQRMYALKVIDGSPLNPISCNVNGFSNMFQGVSELEEVRFVENSIPKGINFSSSSKLSDASRQSIINGLADLTGGTTQTLTVHANIGNKLTDEQKAIITAKNWTLAY